MFEIFHIIDRGEQASKRKGTFSLMFYMRDKVYIYIYIHTHPPTHTSIVIYLYCRIGRTRFCGD